MISKLLALFSPRRLSKKSDYDRLSNETGEKEELIVRFCCLSVVTLTRRQTLIDPKQACEEAFVKAVRSSQACAGNSLGKWEDAKASCKMANVTFRRAIDTLLPNGQTPLRSLASSHDHTSLHFVHSCLPQGFYNSKVYLGALGDALPADIVCSFPYVGPDTARLPRPILPFTYKGDLDVSGICGYGVVTWSDESIYVGQWRSEMSIWFDAPMLRTLTHLCGSEERGDDLEVIYTGPYSDPFTVYSETRPHLGDF